jgi:hypothetical protein
MVKHSFPDKICASCGRRFSWRKKWAKCWEDVKYCSQDCRGRKILDVDKELESLLMRITAELGCRASVCPAVVARSYCPDEDNWRKFLEPVCRAANRLVAQGLLEIVQDGKAVLPTATVRGAIRMRQKRRG